MQNMHSSCHSRSRGAITEMGKEIVRYIETSYRAKKYLTIKVSSMVDHTAAVR